MRTIRSASYARGAFALAVLCAVCAIGFLKSALAAPESRLLYVSDPSTSILAVYSLPNLVQTGSITGLDEPHGLCSDGSGNVWATNYASQEISMYPHGGTTATKTAFDPRGFPFACSVDRWPGGNRELAVANIRNAKKGYAPKPYTSPTEPPFNRWSGPGETEILPDGTVIFLPSSKDYPNMPTVIGEAHDHHGNLYISGRSKAGKFVLAELAVGSSTVTGISLTGATVHRPGMLEWVDQGNYLAVGDRRCGASATTCLYRISLSGSTGTVGNKTTLETYNSQPICDMAQGTIYASAGVTYLVGGDDESACGNASTSVNRWAYPSGGVPINSNHSITLAHPFGTATSAQ